MGQLFALVTLLIHVRVNAHANWAIQKTKLPNSDETIQTFTSVEIITTSYVASVWLPAPT